MELLSPAGNREALTAAVACGADAVYLGYTAFGARSYAGNFDAQGLMEAADYAHERGKKIFVTVNTLVKQAETDDLCDVLELLCRCGVDAVLVQDLGVAHIARERFPQLTLHASTQMTVHNAQGARLMQSLGFARVVPARECSLSELKRMADTGVEVEAFAHGALCVAISGQCLFSSMIGGRSGNRGRCAQPCRLPYQLADGTSGYLLSTKDLMLIERLPALRDAGVYSFKLEGRMKRPEYVGIVTRAYREALDAAQAHVPYQLNARTREALRQIFNRGGFTEGYAMEKSHAALMSWARPGHWGIDMGSVRSVRGALCSVTLTHDLNDGDGLQLRGRSEAEMTYSGKPTKAGQEAIVRVTGIPVQTGDAVYRLTDAQQMQEIRAYVSQERVQIPLCAVLDAQPGENAVLTLSDGDGHCVCVHSEQAAEPAKQHALDEVQAAKQLGKLGGTPYALQSLTLHSEGAFLTAGALNALRRDGIAAMRAARTARQSMPARGEMLPCSLPPMQPMLRVQGESLALAGALLDAGADVFCWQPQCWQLSALEAALAAHSDVRAALVLPAYLTTQELEMVHDWVCRHASRFVAVMLNNVGQFEPKWPVPIWGGQGLNVMNSACASFYDALGAVRLTASCELSARELEALFACGGNYTVEAYGRTQLMLLSHCPRRTLRGDERLDAACNACAKDDGCPAVYTDRRGYSFPARRLQMPHGCLLRLYNSLPTDMVRYAQRLQALSCSLHLNFTDETPERQCELTASYHSVLHGGQALHEMQTQMTSGHLMRGVE